MKKFIVAIAFVLAAGQASAECAAPLRSDLGLQWWNGTCSASNLVWPGNSGSSTSNQLVVLPVGTLLDRFSQAPSAAQDNGKFFSPQGAAYAMRALPYICSALYYRVYRVAQPLTVSAGIAAPWFGQEGGAAQYQTTDGVAALLSAGTIVEEAAPAASVCPTAGS